VKTPNKKVSAWIASGSPWVWLNAAAVSACLLLVGGLLLLITVRGMEYFWPQKVHELIVLDDQGEPQRLVAQIRDRESVPLARLGDSGTGLKAEGGHVTRWLLKTGNRDLAGQDFRWILRERVVQQSAPLSMVVLEREEWGVFFGFAIGLKSDGVLVETEDVWAGLQSELERTQTLRDEIDELESGEIGRINHRLEQLRLRERKLEIRGGENVEADLEALGRITAEREALQKEYDELEARLMVLHAEISRASVVMRTSLAPEVDHDLPLRSIVDAWRPNEMGLPAQLGHFLHKIWAFLSTEPREANTEGGVFPAIFGTVLMVLLMTVFVTPFGVVAGVYLKEYARQGLLTRTIRIAVNNLAGVPSIVYGVFGLGFFIYTLGGSIDRLFFEAALPSATFGTGGLFWASLTLALLTLPIVIVSTEEGLARIPRAIREGSLALGATQWETLWRTIIPMASPGIMTGLILAIARAAGEVAPLMLVGVVKLAPSLPLDGQAPFLHLERKFMHLGFHIYDVGFQSPNVEAARPLVYATALLLVLVILLLNIVAIHYRNSLREKYRGLET